MVSKENGGLLIGDDSVVKAKAIDSGYKAEEERRKRGDRAEIERRQSEDRAHI
jgi:hypothetical protein